MNLQMISEGCQPIPATEPFAPGATSTTQCPVRDGREMPRKAALLLLALALAVAACGGGGESASSTEPGEEPSAEPTSAGEEEPAGPSPRRCLPGRRHQRGPRGVGPQARLRH